MPGGLVFGATEAKALQADSPVERLAADHPEVTVESDAIFVRAEHIWTSASVSTSIDRALALPGPTPDIPVAVPSPRPVSYGRAAA